MGYRFLPNRMYRMPTHFGPATGPRSGPNGERYPCVDSPSTTRWSVRFRTDRAQLEALIPEGFGLQLGSDPVVAVDYTVMKEIDWLAGRGYNTLGVSIPVVFRGERDRAAGPLLTVLWENLADPIITGREELGYAKIYCELPEPRVLNGETHCEASWLGFQFMDLVSRDMRRLTDEEIAGRAGAPAVDGTMHLKYMPRTGDWGAPDVAYVTLTPASGSRAVAKEQWIGKGSVGFHRARWEDMPTQFMIVNALADLEIHEVLGATMTRSVGGKDLSDVRILR
jgi:hypothetical protein